MRRAPEKGRYDDATVERILDRGLVAHVAFVDRGEPVCVPFLHARVERRLYLHGSRASRAMRILAAGEPACVSVTVVDGLVLARSVFEHSANYASVVAFGRFEAVEAAEEKAAALEAFTEKLLPGRWREARQPSAKELKATTVVALPLDEASAKVRSGPPEDAPEDVDLPVWSGVVPIHLAVDESEYDWRRVRDGRLGPPR